jgi:hypothetical protein
MAEVPDGVVGAGTLLTPEDVRAAKAAGAKFGVSPGATDTLIEACIAEGLPLLPGAATASEAMRLFERGYDMLKFFPAEAAGGAPISNPSPDPCRRWRSAPRAACPRQCARLPAPAQRDLRRRLLGGARRHADGRRLGRDRGAGAGRIRARLGGPPPLRPRPAERISAPARNGAEHQSVSCGTGPASPLRALESKRGGDPRPLIEPMKGRTRMKPSKTALRTGGIAALDGHAQPRRASGAGRRRRRTGPDAGGGSRRPRARRRNADWTGFYAGAQIEYGDVDVTAPWPSDGTGGLGRCVRGLPLRFRLLRARRRDRPQCRRYRPAGHRHARQRPAASAWRPAYDAGPALFYGTVGAALRDRGYRRHDASTATAISTGSAWITP